MSIIQTWTVYLSICAHRFRPERWLNLPSSYNSTFSLLSFIAGPHGCIGKTMAIMEMKAILAYVHSNFICFRGASDGPTAFRPFRGISRSDRHRILIAHFSFEPAYAGQVAKPTAAVTMSAYASHLQRDADAESSLSCSPQNRTITFL
jgi:hypothetical protein